jgi:NAD(P)H-nitrite reductase large subunit
MKGAERQGVFTFTTLDDAKAIDQFLNQLRNRTARAVVIGAGIIGAGVAEALVKRGVKVTLVVRSRLMRAILDEEASALEETTLRRAGINLITGHTVAEINSYSGGAVTSVILDDGRPIPCELVIVAAGIQPRTELVAEAGIKINRGIVVDRHMTTSHPDIYACGDVAEAYDIAYGECRLTPIWPNAYIGGRIAGFNMAGRQMEYPAGTAMNSLKYFGLDVVSAGIVNPPDDSYEVLSQSHDSTYRKIILKDGLVVGMVFVGNIEKSGIVLNLLRNQIKVNGFKQALVAEDFSLSSLPEELWRPQLEVPPSALVSPVVTEHHEEEVAGE